MTTPKKLSIGFIIFILISLIYFISAKGNIEISDTYFSVQTTKAIILNHSLSAEGCRGGYCHKSEQDGKYYSKQGLGIAFIFIPYVLLGKTMAILTSLPEEQLTNFLISFYNIFFGAGACAVMFYIIKFFANSNRVSLIMALLLGLGTFAWRYSIWDFSEAAQMFFLLVSVYGVLKNSIKSLTWAAISFCCLFLLKASHLAYLPVFLLYIFIKNRADSKNVFKYLGLFFFIIILGLGFVFLLNYVRFGNIFEFGYGLETNRFYLSGIKHNSSKLLFWLDKGIFIYNPIFILSILGYYKLLKIFRKESILFLSIIALNFCLTASWYGWHGNQSWGPRYLLPTAPLWLMPCFIFFYKKGIIKAMLILFIFISLLIQILSILQGNLEYLTICNANYKEGMRKGAPAQIIGSLIVLKHKIIKDNNLYSLTEFGVNSTTKVDTSSFTRYRGFDFWYLHLAEYFKKPILRYIPVLFLPFIIICFIYLFKITDPASAET